jgi:hypothetical protein
MGLGSGFKSGGELSDFDGGYALVVFFVLLFLAGEGGTDGE